MNPQGLESLDHASIPLRSFPVKSLNYIQQFLDDSLPSHTLYKYSPLWKKKLLKMEKDIKQFMDQQRAIKQSFANVVCIDDDFKKWYSVVTTSRPKIVFQDDEVLPKDQIVWHVNEFDHHTICKTHMGG